VNIGSSNKSVSAKPTPSNFTSQKNLLSEDNPGDNGSFGSQPVGSGMGPQEPGGDSSGGGIGSGPPQPGGIGESGASGPP
jgi:hypothetical protein